MFCVVETIEGDDKFVVAVPTTWLVGGKLLWPPKALFRKTQPVEKRIAPGKDWQILDFKILKENVGKLYS